MRYSRNTMARDAYVPLGVQVVVAHFPELTEALDHYIFIADNDYRVAQLLEVHETAEATATTHTATVKKTSGGAISAGTNVGTSGFNLMGAADTVQSDTPSATDASVELAAGDALGVDFASTGAAPADFRGGCIVVVLVPAKGPANPIPYDIWRREQPATRNLLTERPGACWRPKVGAIKVGFPQNDRGANLTENVNYPIFIAPFPCLLTRITARWVAGSGNCTLRKNGTAWGNLNIAHGSNGSSIIDCLGNGMSGIATSFFTLAANDIVQMDYNLGSNPGNGAHTFEFVPRPGLEYWVDQL